VRNAGEFRIRHDKVDRDGKVTLRYAGKLRDLQVGRAHTGRRVMLLVDDREVRVLSSDGEFRAEVQIDPTKIYQSRKRSDQHIPSAFTWMATESGDRTDRWCDLHRPPR
jgi:hypothetical protein